MQLTNKKVLYLFKPKAERSDDGIVAMAWQETPIKTSGNISPLQDISMYEAYGIKAGEAMLMLTTDMKTNFAKGDGIGLSNEKPEYIIKTRPEKWSQHKRIILEAI